jgi:hypothetical protein
MNEKVSKLDYCQYLLSSQINYTITHFADHTEKFSHDAINRYLRMEKIRPALLWENTKDKIEFSPNGYLIFDDSVLDKCYSRHIEIVRRQWSGNEHRVIRGIGCVNCLYYNPEKNQFWVIDYRIFDPQRDGKTKIDHVKEMLYAAIHTKQIEFRTVLMDSWYACKELMLMIEEFKKIYYCPIKVNRLVNDKHIQADYKPVCELVWNEKEIKEGKIVKIHKFPKYHRVKLLRIPISTDRTDFVVTNDLFQQSAEAAQEESRNRWKVDEFHREIKQVTGIQDCECRKERIQRNHIGCAMLVWTRLKEVAYQTKRTVYDLKYRLLDEYLIQQLKKPTIKFA